jgi:hypothetical protein
MCHYVTLLLPVQLLLLLQAPEYAGYALTEKLFSFRTPQAARAAQAAQAGEDHVKIAEEFAAATKGTESGGFPPSLPA